MTTETTIGWIEEVPALKIELMPDGCLRLEAKDPYGNGDDVVMVHPLHLRFMAEKLGLVREVSASDAEMIRMLRRQSAEGVRVVNTLVRRMRALQERIDHIQMWLCTHSDSQHADLSYEMDYTTGTSEVCDQFCVDLDEMVERVTEVTLAALAETAPVAPGNAALQSDGDSNCHAGAMADGSPGSAREPSGKACANPSEKASAKASVKASPPDNGSLFGGSHG